MKICDNYPLAKSILTERAAKRAELFENYKSIILLKYMKVIVKNPSILKTETSFRTVPVIDN